MRTQSRTCWNCGIEIPVTELDSLPIPDNENGIPLYFISKIIMECSNEHPNECEVKGI